MARGKNHNSFTSQDGHNLNLPFNGIAVAMGGISTDLITNPELREFADKVLTDVIKLANADLTLQGYDESFVYKGEKEKKRLKKFIWSLTDDMGPYKTSTVLDLINNADLEMEFRVETTE